MTNKVWKKSMSQILLAWLAVSAIAASLHAQSAPLHRSQEAEVMLQSAIHTEIVEGDLEKAIEMYAGILERFGEERTLAGKALFHLGHSHEKLGDARAWTVYDRLVREYTDQPELVAEARSRLASRAESAAVGADLVMRKVSGLAKVEGRLGAPSPDGRYLSVVDQSTGNVAVHDLETGETRTLTHIPWPEYPVSSIFSPDSKRVAYSWFGEQGSYDLRIVNLEGSEIRILHGNKEVSYVGPEAWSPDGKWILALISRSDRTQQIVTINVSDGSLTVIKKLGGFIPRKMSLSPDGSHLVYDFPPQEENPAIRDICLLSIDGSREEALVSHPANDMHPLWTPDGKNVLFLSDRRGTWDLWAQEMRDGRPEGGSRLVKPQIGPILPMGFTNKGSLYFGIGTNVFDVYTAELDPEKYEAVSAPTKVIAERTGSQEYPVWSPDGRRLAYVSKRDPKRGSVIHAPFNSILVIRSLDTGIEKEFALQDLWDFRIYQWPSDGQRLLARGRVKQDPYMVFYIDTETGERDVILRSVENERIGRPQLSPEGDKIYLNKYETGSYSIVSRNLRTGEEVIIAEMGMNNRWFPLSPDGERLAVTRIPTDMADPWELTLLDVDSREFRTLFETEPGVMIGSVAWTPDGKYILFTQWPSVNEQERAGVNHLWRIAIEGGEPERVGLKFRGLIGPPRFHPDGRSFVFVAGQKLSEVWVIEGLIPELSGEK